MNEPCKLSLKFKMLRQAQHDKCFNRCVCHSDEGRIPRIEITSFFCSFVLKQNNQKFKAWKLRLKIII